MARAEYGSGTKLALQRLSKLSGEFKPADLGLTNSTTTGFLERAIKYGVVKKNGFNKYTVIVDDAKKGFRGRSPPSCGMRRNDVMDSAFRIVHRTYHAPKGYYWKGTKPDIRQIRATLKREARKLARWVGPHKSQARPKLTLVKNPVAKNE